MFNVLSNQGLFLQKQFRCFESTYELQGANCATKCNTTPLSNIPNDNNKKID
jgi:hypothetical protein